MEIFSFASGISFPSKGFFIFASFIFIAPVFHDDDYDDDDDGHDVDEEEIMLDCRGRARRNNCLRVSLSAIHHCCHHHNHYRHHHFYHFSKSIHHNECDYLQQERERAREKYLQHSVEDFCAATANISLWLRKYFFSGATTTVDTQIATHKFIAALQIGVGGRGNNAEEVMKEESKDRGE